MTETRTVEPTTGGEKGVKDAAFDLIPARPLWDLAELYGRGARKYERRNWQKGYAWSKSYAAAHRHLNLFWQGEDIDPETGSSHLVCAAFHLFALSEWAHTHPELDDRPDKPPLFTSGVEPDWRYLDAYRAAYAAGLEHHRPGDCPACKPK